MTEDNHAIQNAQSWAQSVVEMIDAVTAAQESEDWDAEEAAQQAINEAPLSVTYRTAWLSAEEFYSHNVRPVPHEVCILLTTGGPGLRIVSPLDDTNSARLEWQDWGEPWTEHRLRDERQRDALACFVDRFAFEAV